MERSPETKGRKVCIVGFSPTTRFLAPFHRDDLEFWGMNTVYEHLPENQRWHRWFEMHGVEFLEKHRDKWPKHLDWLRQFPNPIYMPEHHDSIPQSITYPLPEIEKRFFLENPLAVRVKDGQEISEHTYFTNTVALQMALALYEGDVSEIHIYGIDMVKDSEWGYQRPNCEYFIGLARGMGIKVVMPETAALCRGQWLYGFDTDTPKKYREVGDYLEQREKELRGELEKIAKEQDAVLAKRYVHDGARQECLILIDKLKDVSRGADFLVNRPQGEK